MTPAMQQRLADLYKSRGIAHKQIVTILRRANPVADNEEDAPEVQVALAEFHRQLAIERYQHEDTPRRLYARRHILERDNPIARKAS